MVERGDGPQAWWKPYPKAFRPFPQTFSGVLIFLGISGIVGNLIGHLRGVEVDLVPWVVSLGLISWGLLRQRQQRERR